MDIALSYLLSTFETRAVSLRTPSGDDLYSFNEDDANTETESVPVTPSFGTYFFSNLATKAVVDLLANGAEHGSKTQNDLIFHSRGKPIDWVNEIFPLTVEFLTETGNAGGPRIKYLTAIWVDQSMELQEPFNKVIRDIYKSDVYSQEFAKRDDLIKEVNEWIKEKTGGLVEDSLDSKVIRFDTRLILTAALHFEGEWFEPFHDAGVQKFKLLSGEEVDMPFMTCQGMHYVKEFKDHKLLSIPFKQDKASRFSMLFYLPNNIQDTQKLRDFVGQHEDVIQSVYFPKEQVQVGDFLIPKFKLNVRGPMIWNPPFDFPVMANSPTGLFSRGGRLTSFLEINETGVRAAGVSTFFVDKKPKVRSFDILPYSIDKIEFVANRPFIFFIRDNRFGRMLFSGALINPVGE